MNHNIASLVCQFCGDIFPVKITVDDKDLEALVEKLRYAHLCQWALDELSCEPRLHHIEQMIESEDSRPLAQLILRLERRVDELLFPKRDVTPPL